MKLKLLALVLLLFAGTASAADFSVNPNFIVFGYSDEDFFLPKVEVVAGASAVNLSVRFACVENVDCLVDFCTGPSKLFLVAGEARRIRFECELEEGESRLLSGRAFFISDENSSRSVDIIVSPKTSIPGVPIVGEISLEGDLVPTAIFWFLILALAVLFLGGLFTQNAGVWILFLIVLLIFFFLFIPF